MVLHVIHIVKKEDYMLELVRKLKDLVLQYPERRSKGQKEQFINEINSFLSRTTWTIKSKKERVLSVFSIRNIYINCSDITNCDVLLMAHYDTPKSIFPLIPYFSKKFGMFAGTLIFSGVLAIFEWGLWILDQLISNNLFLFLTFNILFLYIVLSSKKNNPQNTNDNSSGVIAALAISQYIMQEKSELIDRIGIILTDKEESGLIGSGAVIKLLKMARKKDSKYQPLILNFDSVGVPRFLYLEQGKHVCIKKNLKNKLDSQLSCFENTGKFSPLGVMSDLYFLKKEKCFGFIFLQKSECMDSYYLANVHTAQDTYIDDIHLAHFCKKISNFIIGYLENPNQNPNASRN